MISKEVLHVTNEITKFGANHVTVSVFASIVYFTIKDMQMYCLDQELGELSHDKSNQSWKRKKPILCSKVHGQPMFAFILI